MRFSQLITRATACVVAAGAVPSAAQAMRSYRRYTAERDDVTYNVVEDEARGAKLEFVTNSGICETTPGVNSYSGYLSVGPNMNMFFW